MGNFFTSLATVSFSVITLLPKGFYCSYLYVLFLQTKHVLLQLYFANWKKPNLTSLDSGSGKIVFPHSYMLQAFYAQTALKDVLSVKMKNLSF